jgi:hypothetical protein
VSIHSRSLPTIPSTDQQLLLLPLHKSSFNIHNENMPESVTSGRAISRDIFSATLGSVCCCYVGQPFDTVKVRVYDRIDRQHPVSLTLSLYTRCACKPTPNSLVPSRHRPRPYYAMRYVESFICNEMRNLASDTVTLTLIHSIGIMIHRALLPFGKAPYPPLLAWRWKMPWPLVSMKP